MNAPGRPTAVIADDEPELRRQLARMLAAAWPELEIVASVGNGEEALAAIRHDAPDVAFLDIRMPGLNGLAVAARANGACELVFVTAWDEYAVRAFEHAAVDYLVKPVLGDRLARTVLRLRERLATRARPDASQASGGADLDALIERLALRVHGDAGSTGPAEPLAWLRVGTGDGVELVHVDEVVFFRADRKYTSAFTADREHLLRTAIGELETRLDPAQFWRVHRSTIVAVQAIAEARRDHRGRYELRLRDRNERIPVSERHAERFRRM